MTKLKHIHYTHNKIVPPCDHDHDGDGDGNEDGDPVADADADDK